MPEPAALLDAGALAALLKLSKKTILNKLSLLRAGRLPADTLPPAISIGGAPRWRPADVAAWIDALPLEAPQDRQAEQTDDKAQQNQQADSHLGRVAS